MANLGSPTPRQKRGIEEVSQYDSDSEIRLPDKKKRVIEPPRVTDADIWLFVANHLTELQVASSTEPPLTPQTPLTENLSSASLTKQTYPLKGWENLANGSAVASVEIPSLK